MIQSYRDDPDLQNLIDWIQKDWLHCCGVTNYRNWESNIYFNCSSKSVGSVEACGVPSSCCRAEYFHVNNERKHFDKSTNFLSIRLEQQTMWLRNFGIVRRKKSKRSFLRFFFRFDLGNAHDLHRCVFTESIALVRTTYSSRSDCRCRSRCFTSKKLHSFCCVFNFVSFD